MIKLPPEKQCGQMLRGTTGEVGHQSWSMLGERCGIYPRHLALLRKAANQRPVWKPRRMYIQRGKPEEVGGAC